MSTPRQYGRYTVTQQLGKGGFATVYKAHDTILERFVALKVLHSYWAEDPDFVSRFKYEARTAANLTHPNIVTIYDTGQEEGHLFIAMTYVDGQTLDRVLEQEGLLSIERATRIIEQMAAALDYAHGQGVLHRDIKPSNIIVENAAWGESVKLLDFGLVKAMQNSAALTSTGSLLGTPAYMSPEQVHGDRNLDGRSDIYSLGIVLYQMLTGALPYEADTPTRQMMKHVLDPVPDILATKPDLPPATRAVIQKVLAKQPGDRYQSGAELVAALRALDAQRAVPVPPPVMPREEVTVRAQAAKEADPVLPVSPAAPVERKSGIPAWVWVAGTAVVVLLLGLWALRSLLDGGANGPEDTLSQFDTAEPGLVTNPSDPTTASETEVEPTDTTRPTATSRPVDTPTRAPVASAPGCLPGDVWTPHPAGSVQADSNNCWQLADWGIESEGEGLAIDIASPTQEQVRGVSMPLSGNAEINFDIRIDQLWTSRDDALTNLAFGILPAHFPENFGHLYYQKESPREDYPILLKHRERGGFDAYMTWAGSDDYIVYEPGAVDHIRMSLVNNQLNIYLNGTQVAGPTNIDFADRYFWIGYRLPVDGAIEATISNLRVE